MRTCTHPICSVQKKRSVITYGRQAANQFTLLVFLSTAVMPTFLKSQTSSACSIQTLDEEIVCRDCAGVKAILLNAEGSRVYSVNLEGMSVIEFDRSSKQKLRKLKFVATPGKGFDYSKKVWIDSYEEKPVEGCFTHDGRYLWLSLHNAKGVVIWDLWNHDTYVEGRPYKEAWLYDYSAPRADQSPMPEKKKVRLLWIQTGTTPKVVTAAPDGKYLFVSNWHSNTVSILDIASHNPAEWKKIDDLSLGPIPRGLTVAQDSKTLYVAQMGGRTVSVVDLLKLQKIRSIDVGLNPRHLLIHNNCLYVSLNRPAKLVKIDLLQERMMKTADTGRTPRTIVCTPDGRFLFVTCYKENLVQLFATDSMQLLQSWESPGHPVCIDVFQHGNEIEAWVGNHTYGTVRRIHLKWSDETQGN